MDIKFNCSNAACGRRIAVDESMAGNSVHCPACDTRLTVPKSLDIRFKCTNTECGQHIVVAVSEAGRVIRCPSCGKVSQIPGSPPKSLGSESIRMIREKKEEQQRLLAAAGNNPAPPHDKPPRSRFYPFLTAGWRLLCGWTAGTAAVLAFYACAEPLHHRLSDTGNAVLANRIFGLPAVNDANTTLYYAQAVYGGANVYRLNLISSKQILVGHIEGEVGPKDFKWLGWSPDQRYVAYFVNTPRNPQQLVILPDSITRAIPRTFDVRSFGGVVDGTWLAGDSLVLLSSADTPAVLNLKANAALGKYGKEGLVPLDAMAGKKTHWLARDSDYSIAYTANHGISALDIPTGKKTDVLTLPQGRIEGLQYSLENGKYLLSIHQHESDKDDWHCYEYGPRGDSYARLTQLTGEFSTNAAWILQGSGIAYLGRQGSWKVAPKKGQSFVGTNYLAVKTRDSALCTNLFTSGTIQGFTTDPAGSKIYAVAAQRRGLTTIWQYDIAARSLRDILPPNRSFEFVDPVEAIATNDDGTEVAYYFIPPANFDPHKKYPVVLDNYLANSYELSGQLLANSGIYYVSPNHFGVTDWEAAPLFEESMAVYKALLKNPNIDPKRIYVSGTSKSTIVASQLVDTHPELWRGMILLSPIALPRLSDGMTKFPCVFISTGDKENDQFRTNSEQFILNACRHSIPAHLDYQHAPHAYQPKIFMDSYEAAAKFILAND